MAEEVRFDDLEGLRRKVGADFGPWGSELEITQEMIQEFADLTGDHQWIHVDVERAKQGPFGAPIAHGLLTLSLIPLVRPSLGFDIVGESSRVNYGSDGFRFLAPVFAGSKIHARMRLKDVREHTRGTNVIAELDVHVVGSERPSLVYYGMLLYQP